MPTVTLRVSDEIGEALDARAKDLGLSRSDFVRKAIEDALRPPTAVPTTTYPPSRQTAVVEKKRPLPAAIRNLPTYSEVQAERRGRTIDKSKSR